MQAEHRSGPPEWKQKPESGVANDDEGPHLRSTLALLTDVHGGTCAPQRQTSVRNTAAPTTQGGNEGEDCNRV